jgi:antitoxin VapB
VCISIDTVDIIQAAKSDSWDTFFIAQAAAVSPKDFLSKIEREQDLEQRDPFEGWSE